MVVEEQWTGKKLEDRKRTRRSIGEKIINFSRVNTNVGITRSQLE